MNGAEEMAQLYQPVGLETGRKGLQVFLCCQLHRITTFPGPYGSTLPGVSGWVLEVEVG